MNCLLHVKGELQMHKQIEMLYLLYHYGYFFIRVLLFCLLVLYQHREPTCLSGKVLETNALLSISPGAK